MKNKTRPIIVADLEKDVEDIAPLVRQAFLMIEGPSQQVTRAIQEYSLAQARGFRRRHFIPLFRILTAAASLMLLLGGAIQMHLVHSAGANARAVTHLLHISAPLTASTA